MALALTIFAVEGPGLAPTFCHVLLRMARGHGAYPPPLLPKTPALPPPVARSAINGTNLTLLVWDRSVSDVDAADLLVALDRGDFSVPADAPHLHNLHIPGAVYGPVIVDEPMQRANVSGSGMLLLRGLATEAPLKALVDALTVAVPPGSAPTTVKAISAAIVGASSIGDVLKPQLVLGGVDYYHRPIPPSASEGALFNVAAPPPDVRNPRPMNRVIVRRHAALLGTPYRLVLRLGDSDSTLADTILDIEAGVAEVTVSAPGHINDIDMRVFTPAGVLVDQLNGRFGQEMQFDLTVLSGADTLPPPFAGAPDAKDLQTRTRVTTTHFERPAPKGLSAGLGVLRKARGQLERLVGKDPQDLEDIWFDRGPNSQIEGIRWLKTKMESPRVSHAYLVDPFLGSEALTRVIARQGNESIDLKVLVSPGNVDPDSGSVDTPSGGDFLDRLAATAAEWSDRLAC